MTMQPPPIPDPDGRRPESGAFVGRVMDSVDAVAPPSATRSFVDAARTRAAGDAADALVVASHLAIRGQRVPLAVRVQALALVLVVACAAGTGITLAATAAVHVAGPVFGLGREELPIAADDLASPSPVPVVAAPVATDHHPAADGGHDPRPHPTATDDHGGTGTGAGDGGPTGGGSGSGSGSDDHRGDDGDHAGGDGSDDHGDGQDHQGGDDGDHHPEATDRPDDDGEHATETHRPDGDGEHAEATHEPDHDGAEPTETPEVPSDGDPSEPD